ncbi:hypothetical protein JHK86_016433 [Glycine max]|nr:hypothetical protein JHK86_016433 [Glycine max]
MQEPQKSADSIIKKLWVKILGIGLAFRTIMSMSRDDRAKKFRHWWDEFKYTLQHYYFGTKLLWANIRISSKLLLKLVGGKSLSRRERQQLTRTTIDIFRLVPFVVFIIVPFVELLLAVFLKLFPNMLPSIFQDKMKELVRTGARVSNDEILGFAKLFNDELTLDNISSELQGIHYEIQPTEMDLEVLRERANSLVTYTRGLILGDVVTIFEASGNDVH